MSLSTVNGFLNEEIPTYLEFSAEQKLPHLDFNFIIDGVSSLPLYERLDFNKEILCEEEMRLMNLQAKKYDAVYKPKLTKNIEDVRVDNNEGSINLESGYAEDEGEIETFLKHFYNCSENDELVTKLKENLNLEGVFQESSFEEDLSDVNKICAPSKEFSEFFLKTSDGIHDDFLINETISSQDSCSDVSSEEKDESKKKAKKLSDKLKFNDSSNTKILDHIINTKKPETFKTVPESSIKKPVLQIHHMFQSESESDSEIGPQKNHKISKDDEMSKEILHNRGKKGKMPHRKIKQKPIVKEFNKNFKKATENKLEVLAKPTKEKNNVTHTHCPVRIFPNVKGMDQIKTSEEHLSAKQHNSNKSILAVAEESSSAKVVTQMSVKQTKKQIEISASSDEDWQDLAEKNLYLRSKTLEQKAAQKK